MEDNDFHGSTRDIADWVLTFETLLRKSVLGRMHPSETKFPFPESRDGSDVGWLSHSKVAQDK